MNPSSTFITCGCESCARLHGVTTIGGGNGMASGWCGGAIALPRPEGYVRYGLGCGMPASGVALEVQAAGPFAVDASTIASTNDEGSAERAPSPAAGILLRA